MKLATWLLLMAAVMPWNSAYSMDGCEEIILNTPNDGAAIPPIDIDALTKLNTNAQIPAEFYAQGAQRTFEHYSNVYGSIFAQKIQQALVKIWFDSGSAFGFAPLKAVTSEGFVAVLISSQDFWTPAIAKIKKILIPKKLPFYETKQPPLTLEEDPRHVWGHIVVRSVEGVATSTIKAMGSALGLKMGEEEGFQKSQLDMLVIPKGMTHAEFDLRLRKYLKAIPQTFENLVQGGRLQIKIGFAEKIIRTLTTSADVITDLFGAYHYSVMRKFLLESYYEKLTSDGIAFVYLGDRTNWKNDIIRTSEGDIAFVDYLQKKYPENFQIVEGWRLGADFRPKTQFSLVIRKTPGLTRLVLPFDFRPEEVTYTQDKTGDYKAPDRIIYYPQFEPLFSDEEQRRPVHEVKP